MRFELDEDQREFKALLRTFVDKEIVPVAREWEQSGRYPTEIVDGMKEMGLFGITVPEEYGGLDLDPVSFALVFEEIARGWMGVAGILGSHSLACRLIAMHGTQDQKDRYLPELATGERRTGIGLTEPDAGTDLQGIRTTARLDGDHYVVNGAKMWITNARYADPLPVLVKTDPQASPAHRGMSVLLIEADTPGYEVTKDIAKLGYKGTESCEIALTDVRVPVSQLVGGVEGTMLGSAAILSRLIDDATLLAHAHEIAQAALAFYDAEDRLWGQDPAFNAIFFENLHLLGEVAGNHNFYRAALAAYTERAWTEGRDPRTGLCNFGRRGRVDLLAQSAAVRLFALSAAIGEG